MRLRYFERTNKALLEFRRRRAERLATPVNRKSPAASPAKGKPVPSPPAAMRGKAQSTATALETRLANRPAVEELAEKGLIADENGQARDTGPPYSE